MRPCMNTLSYSTALHVNKVTTSLGSVLGTTRLKTVLFKKKKKTQNNAPVETPFLVGFKLSWCEAQALVSV